MACQSIIISINNNNNNNHETQKPHSKIVENEHKIKVLHTHICTALPPSTMQSHDSFTLLRKFNKYFFTFITFLFSVESNEKHMQMREGEQGGDDQDTERETAREKERDGKKERNKERKTEREIESARERERN